MDGILYILKCLPTQFNRFFAEEIQYSFVPFYAFFSFLKIKRNGENLKRNGIFGIAFIFKLPDLIYVVVGSEWVWKHDTILN